MTTAVVTGASRGLGAVFADRLAAGGYDLVLVARDRAGLDGVAAAARGRGARVQVLAADLADPASRAVVERRLADPNQPIDLLVNNAGVEAEAEFIHAGPGELQAEVDVNVTAVLQLTRAVLPGMCARGDGAVINVASFAGYLAARGSAYAATKAWVLTFTDTVSASLSGSGVSMIAVCPGKMRTGKHDAPDTASPLWLDPAAVVDRCLADLARGRTLSTPGPIYRLVVNTLELPRRTLRGLARLTGRNRQHRTALTVTQAGR